MQLSMQDQGAHTLNNIFKINGLLPFKQEPVLILSYNFKSFISNTSTNKPTPPVNKKPAII